MPTTLNIPNIDVQSNKLVITDNPVVIDSDGYGTTPLADVDSETSADTILGVKDGAVVQLDPDELKDELGIDDLETEVGHIYSTTWTDNGMTFVAYRIGRMAQVHANSGSVTTEVSAGGTLTTIPVGFRPQGTDVCAWDAARASRLSIGTSGAIVTITTMTASIQPRFFASYICQNTLPT